VAVSCGAIPETLIEAELFGHEKGAFTGTVGAREGYFEQAADGTLFLDEIGDLSLFTQVKLLRVLQQMEFSRLGSNRLVPLRARLIFATHQDLSKLVAEGKFRQDLFYRINVMRLNRRRFRSIRKTFPGSPGTSCAYTADVPEADGRYRSACSRRAAELSLARQRA
jgi:transcriptional regulator with GAF, ATPase, and Fis domain